MKKLALALAILALPAAAEAVPGYHFELTPSVGYRFGGTLSAQDQNLFNTDLRVKDSAAFGLNFDIPLSSGLQLELLANHQPTHLQTDTGLFGSTQNLADFDLDYYHVGILAQWGNRRIEPFFVASAGVSHLDPKISGTTPDDRFSVSVGGGVKVFFSENIGLRFEARGFWTDLSNYHHRYGYYYNDGGDLSQGLASVGLIFAW